MVTELKVCEVREIIEVCHINPYGETMRRLHNFILHDQGKGGKILTKEVISWMPWEETMEEQGG